MAEKTLGKPIDRSMGDILKQLERGRSCKAGDSRRSNSKKMKGRRRQDRRKRRAYEAILLVQQVRQDLRALGRPTSEIRCRHLMP